MHHFLACYDISSDKNRSRVEKILLRYGQRVQKSVYEIRLPLHNLQSVVRECQSYLEECDSLRFYLLCSTCRETTMQLTRTQWKVNWGPLVV
ncbi:MAG: CRISPR-associated endonuclease Cas2 [Candidatus Omnitrophica bacterium]|nr:CRISPR-associated endonuclease Cas2 [Candidatus Omnitrophota bacterium]HPP02658.1 CRISPR-associated endonuclease Cas2 [bacterium]